MRYHTIRFQESGTTLPAATLAGAKKHVRAIFPTAHFVDERHEGEGIACEVDGYLVARITGGVTRSKTHRAQPKRQGPR